ncbi:MAG TPA: hypothetical protein VGH79_08895 [Gaiellaceae bacterium]|jgi:hypothetical protein
MSADATTPRSGLPPFYRRRRFWRNSAPIVAMVAAFVVGIGIYGAFGSSGAGVPTKPIPLPDNPPTPKTVKLSKQETAYLHGIVKQFVMTSVARKHLAQGYHLIGPALRENISKKEWARGGTTVVPYPVDKKTWLVFEKPDWSYRDSVRFQVHVITPDEPLKVKEAGVYTFYVDLLKRHHRWVVNNWVPRWTPPIPNARG